MALHLLSPLPTAMEVTPVRTMAAMEVTPVRITAIAMAATPARITAPTAVLHPRIATEHVEMALVNVAKNVTMEIHRMTMGVTTAANSSTRIVETMSSKRALEKIVNPHSQNHLISAIRRRVDY